MRFVAGTVASSYPTEQSHVSNLNGLKTRVEPFKFWETREAREALSSS